MKLGLKDTLTLLAKGYSKKEIQELEKQEAEELQADKEQEETPAPAPDPVPEKEEPDYKKMFEELKAQSDKNEADLKELQKKNRTEDVSEEIQKKQQEANDSLLSLVRSYM